MSAALIAEALRESGDLAAAQRAAAETIALFRCTQMVLAPR